MNFQVLVSDSVDQLKWDQALRQNKNSITYQAVNWQRMFFEVYGSKPFFIMVLDSNSKIVGQLAGIIHEKWYWRDANILFRHLGPLLRLGTVIHWFYGPIIHEKKYQSQIILKILKTIDEIAIKNNAVMIRGLTSPLEKNSPIQEFKKSGYDIKSGATFVLDLTKGKDVIYNSLSKDVRYYIRRSEKIGYKFEIAKNKNLLFEFGELKKDAYRLEGRKVIKNTSFYETHWNLLHQKNNEQLLIARKDGENVGGILVLFFNQNSIQHALVNAPKYDLVGMFLTWNTIKWAIDQKFTTFDFAGVNPNPQNPKEKGIYYYASKWGGDLLSYNICTKFLNKSKYRLLHGIKDLKSITNVFGNHY